MEDLRDKHIVVTGATGPLGEAVCALALASGARVSAVSISRTMLDALRAELRQHDRLHTAECDLADAKGVKALFDALYAPLLRSPMLVTRAAVRRMAPRGAGRIVLTGGLASARPSPNMAVYGALKAAVAHFVTSVAAEVRRNGVTVNAVLPGTLDTPANRKSMPDADSSRWVAPLTVAKAVGALLGEAGIGVSGALVAVPDGGT